MELVALIQYLYLILIMHMCVQSIYTCVRVLTEARRGCMILWSCNYRDLWVREQKSGPLEEQQEHLAEESPSQTQVRTNCKASIWLTWFTKIQPIQLSYFMKELYSCNLKDPKQLFIPSFSLCWSLYSLINMSFFCFTWSHSVISDNIVTYFYVRFSVMKQLRVKNLIKHPIHSPIHHDQYLTAWLLRSLDHPKIWLQDCS